jgi:hypothetical protein
MQFAILLIGAMLFAFYSFYQAPLNFNESAYRNLKVHQPQLTSAIESDYQKLHHEYQSRAAALAANRDRTHNDSVQVFLQTQNQVLKLRDSVQRMITAGNYAADRNDTNYIFLYFVKNTLPKGLVGLLFAVIFLASWGSISAALNSLAGSSLMDVQLLAQKIPPSEDKQLWLGRMHTLAWGVFCIGVAMFATRMGSLIEAVNILGSLFYGTILGIFLVAFYLKRIDGRAVFNAAIIAEAGVVLFYIADIVSFLWLNVIGALLVIIFSLLQQMFRRAS